MPLTEWSNRPHTGKPEQANALEHRRGGGATRCRTKGGQIASKCWKNIIVRLHRPPSHWGESHDTSLNSPVDRGSRNCAIISFPRGPTDSSATCACTATRTPGDQWRGKRWEPITPQGVLGTARGSAALLPARRRPPVCRTQPCCTPAALVAARRRNPFCRSQPCCTPVAGAGLPRLPGNTAGYLHASPVCIIGLSLV